MADAQERAGAPNAPRRRLGLGTPSRHPEEACLDSGVVPPPGPPFLVFEDFFSG